jgi:hypothetical protein
MSEVNTLKELITIKRNWSMTRISSILVMTGVLQLITLAFILVVDIDDKMFVLSENVALFSINFVLLLVLLLAKYLCMSFFDNMGMLMFFISVCICIRYTMQNNATSGGNMMLKDFAWPFLSWICSYLSYTFMVSVHCKRDMIIRVISTVFYVNLLAGFHSSPPLSLLRYNAFFFICIVLIEANSF